MANDGNDQEKSRHLRSGLIYLLAWVGVLIFGVQYVGDGGIIANILKYRNGDFAPLLVACASVVLLALVLKSMFSYLAARSRHGQKNPGP